MQTVIEINYQDGWQAFYSGETGEKLCDGHGVNLQELLSKLGITLRSRDADNEQEKQAKLGIVPDNI